MLVLAHRGYHIKSIENTYEAFDKAIDLHVDGIETDIQMSKDNQLILFHSYTLPNGYKVSSLSQSELSTAVGYKVPTLNSVLDKYKDILWNLEIKVPTILDAVVEVVREFYHSRRLLITSFWHPVIEQFSRCLNVDCGVLVDHRPFLQASPPLGWWPKKNNLNTIVWYYPVVDGEILEQTVNQGIRNFVYGVETESDWLDCVRLKIDGVITDRPDILLSIRNRGV